VATNALDAMAKAHMAQQVREAAVVQAALSRLWDETIDPSDLTRTFLLFRERATPIIGGGRIISERTADAYYAKLLAFKGLDPDGTVAPSPIAAAQIKSSLSASTAKSLARAEALQRRGVGSAEALAAAKSNMLGSAKRQILNASRTRLTARSRAHRRIRGWARVSDGAPCGFCAMLVGRGPVYSEDGAYFAAHDRCGCSVRLVTYDDADGGWSDEARAYRDAYNEGAIFYAYGKRRTRSGKANNLAVARWEKGMDAETWLADWRRRSGASSVPDAGDIARAAETAAATLGFPRLAQAEAYADAVKHANPFYAENRDYQNNCHLVSAAMELRARGLDVQARPTIGARGRYDPQMEGDWRDAEGNIRPFTKVEEAVGRKLAAGPRLTKALDELTADYPDGARGFITGAWRTGGGHIWNWQKVDGKIVYYDGQPDGYTPDQVKGYLTRLKADTVSILRLDDLVPADRVKDLVATTIEASPIGHRRASLAYAEAQLVAAREDIARLREQASQEVPEEVPGDEYARRILARRWAAAYADAIERGLPALESEIREYRQRVAALEAMAL